MSPTLCFKRWSRKNYAVFASLHRVVKIGVVTFSCSLIQERYQPVFAQLDTATHFSEEATLDEVEISASQPLLWTSLPFVLSTVEQKDIAAAPAADLDEVLERLPGVDIRQRSPDGVQADISLNGGSFDQVLILLNGVNITDPQTGHFNLDIPIDLSQIKRIEVVRGSAAGILGSNAFSGAINLITVPSSLKNGFSGKVELGTGSFRRLQAGAELNHTSDRLSLTGTASFKTSDGHDTNTDYRIENGTFLAGYQHPSMGKFLLQMGCRNKEYGANSFYSLAYPLQFEATTTLYSALTWEKSTGHHYLLAQAYRRSHHDRFELFRDGKNAASWYSGHNYHLSDVSGGKFTLTKSNTNFYSLLGIEFRNEHIFSNVLGEALIPNKPDPFDAVAVFTKAKNRSTFSGITHQRIQLDKVQFSLGATLNITPGIGFYWQGGVDGLYQINKSSTASVSLNRSLRLPTFTDLYYQSATQRSNPALRPEEALTINGQLEWKNNVSRFSLNGFHRWGKGLIDWVRHPDSLRWESQNLTAVQATGVSLEGGWHPYVKGGWHPLIKGCHPLSFVANYTVLFMDKSAQGFDSKYALDYLKHKLTLKATGLLLETKQLGQVSMVIDAGFYVRSGTYSVPGITGLIKYEPYWLADSRVKWTRNGLSIYVDAYNLFNVPYTDFGGLSQPGLNLRTGLSVSF
jgi:vitamin B12 transporter